MPKTGTLSQINAVEDYNTSLILKSIVNLVDGGLTFGDNIQGKIIRNIFFHSTALDIPIDHNLGRVTTDFIVLNCNTFARFRRGQAQGSLPTQDRLYIQCDVANTTADILILG